MKTKFVKFEAPKESTIYDPPLEFVSLEGCSPIYKKLYAYIRNRKSQLVFEDGSEIFMFGSYFIEVPDEAQRMTSLQVARLLNSGGWIAKTVNGEITDSIRFEQDEISKMVESKFKVSLINKIEWIEPTTDLLED